MIDFKTKTFYFGYGDIIVNNSTLGLKFIECEPPVEVGMQLTKELEKELGVKFTSDWVTIPIKYYEEAKEFEKLLDELDGRDKFQFYFKDYLFNFSIWNPKSIESIKRHLNIVRSNLLMCCAC